MEVSEPTASQCRSRADEKYDVFCLWKNLHGFLHQDATLSEAKVSSSADDGSESEDCHPIDEVYGSLRAAISEHAKANIRKKRKRESLD